MFAFRGSLTVVFLAVTAAAQTPLGTTSTYQGRLKDAGAPASGDYDFQFTLYDAAVGGAVVGSDTADDWPVAAGLFTAWLDFGAGVFNGQARWLEIGVRPWDSVGPYTPLTPRHELTPTPYGLYAVTAATATNADTVDGLHANPAPAANTLLPLDATSKFPNSVLRTGSGNGLDADLLDGQQGSFYQNASNTNAGTLADARLSANVATLQTNQTFTGGKAFSAAPAFTAGGTPFTVNSSTLVTNLNADFLDGLDSTAFLQSIPVPLTLSGAGVHVIKGDNTSSASGVSGVYGVSSAATGASYGGRFESASNSGRGAYGWASAASGTTYGVYGRSDSPSGRGVYGHAVATSGDARGVFGVSNSTAGLGTVGYATSTTGTTSGVYGQSDSSDGHGVYGLATNADGITYGVHGQSDSVDGVGVYGESANKGVYGYSSGLPGGWYGVGVLGQSSATDGKAVVGWASNYTNGATFGGHFTCGSTNGVGVYGSNSSADGSTYGGKFTCDSTAGRAAYGRAYAATGTTYGGRFEADSAAGRGVYGAANATGTSDTPYGVRGYCSTATAGYAVYAAGDMGASGTKPFRIDHPDDPENKYLLHYAAESPEVINFYRGTVVLDGAGEAVVSLPPYFAKINKDPSYQLTAVGAPMPMLHVADKISDEALSAGEQAGPGDVAPVCSFRIAGGVPRGEVSWRVEAMRNDLRVRVRGAPVECEKLDPERGTYQHPEYYGQPAERGMDYDAKHMLPSAPRLPDNAPR